MAKKLLSITVQGNQAKWGFDFYGDPKYIQEWKADGLDIVQIENTIPMWVAEYGLITQWCFMQDLLNFKNPFADKAGKVQTIEVPHEDEE